MLIKFIAEIKNFINFMKLNYDKKEFVFYSETKYYRNFFIGLVNEITLKHNRKVIFLTGDIEDLNFFKKKNIDVYYIGNGIVRQIIFNFLKCKFCIMTLTDLNNNLKKSRLCKKYVYFFHALGSTHKIYKKEAFKHYDLVFCNGHYQYQELRAAEKTFNFKPKEIIRTGYFYLDYISSLANFQKVKKNSVLFAPSWNYGKKNLFYDYSHVIIDNLIKFNFNVILRQHPEQYKRSKSTINSILKKYGGNLKFTLDKSYSNLSSLEKSELLITDNSTIALEFTLAFNRPVLYINYIDKIHNPKHSRINLVTLESLFKEKFGHVIEINDIINIGNHCKSIIKNKNFTNEDIFEFKKRYLSNIGLSAHVAANYLVKLSKEIS